ncbi:hypothetical protein SDC9_151897 [bioreactor metagenome]|uniref:Metallo-beta-lactamase domain-containing protein n=1 Tax=bioreactor metagenome TaxID=1076179 RepID=A0A645ETV4_9ZZZZ
MLSPSFLYGGFPLKELKNHFLLAEGSEPEDIRNVSLPEGFETIDLPGHFFGMIGVKTPDDIYFLGDCLFGENIIDKYHVFFIYDVKEFFNTLERVEGLDGKLYIPSHAKATCDIRPLVRKNRDKMIEMMEKILSVCKENTIFEDILKRVFDEYNLFMDFNQYVLVGNTVRSYLSYLADEGRVGFSFEANHVYWKAL